jgi:TatD DNase family protein
LAPAPYRGKRNESSYTKLVAEKLADVKGLSLKEVSEKTSENAKTLFDF